MKIQNILESEFDNIDPANVTVKRDMLTDKKISLEKEQAVINVPQPEIK